MIYDFKFKIFCVCSFGFKWTIYYSAWCGTSVVRRAAIGRTHMSSTQANKEKRKIKEMIMALALCLCLIGGLISI